MSAQPTLNAYRAYSCWTEKYTKTSIMCCVCIGC